MKALIESHTSSIERPADTTTANEQIGKNLTTWLNLIEMAVSPMDNPQESVVDAYWNQGHRPDGRTFSEPRPYRIQHGALTPSSSALDGNYGGDVVGSAMVRVGLPKSDCTTIVLASVTTQVGQPSVAAPKQGDVLVAVSSCTGVRSSNAHSILSLQSFLQRILEENMDLEQLLLVEGKAAYRLVINISLLHDDSSTSSATLIDVCLAAAVSALLDTKLPAQPVINDGIVSAYESMRGVETKPINMPIVPCSLTAIKWYRETDKNGIEGESAWIVDPEFCEQQVQTSCATIVVDATCSSVGTSLPPDPLLSVQFAPNTFNTSTRAFTTTSELSQLIQIAMGHAETLYDTILTQTQQVSSQSMA